MKKITIIRRIVRILNVLKNYLLDHSIMAESEAASCPVGVDQQVISDCVIVNDMCTVGALNSVTTEICHIPQDKFVYLVANSENQLSFVSGRNAMTSSSRLDGAHLVANGGITHGASARMNTAQVVEPDRQSQPSTFRSSLELEVAATKHMLSKQQTAISSLTDTIKSLQDEIRGNKAADAPVAGTSGINMKPKVNFFEEVSSSEMSESDEYSEDEPPTKRTKHDVSSSDRLTKLDSLFSEKSDHGPPVNASLAKSLNRGIGNDFSMRSVLDFAENYKRPDNCEFLCVPKLNEELFFEESINSRFKKNDGVLQKTQLLLTKGMIPLVQLMDKLLKKDDANHESEIFDLATDSLQLLAYTHRDISNVRRKFLKPAVAQKYKRLCSAHVPLSSYLLGDDLDKQLKSINERKRIGVQMTHEQSRKRFHERSFQQPSTSQGSYGARPSSQSFLYKQRSHRPKYKKETRTKSYNSNNYNNKSK